jgi:hypothetical protein
LLTDIEEELKRRTKKLTENELKAGSSLADYLIALEEEKEEM